MTTPRTNFPSFELQRNSTKATTAAHRQSSHDYTPEPRTSSKRPSPKKKGDENFKSLYEGNFHAENLDYINLLLKNKTSSNKEKAKEAARKKGHNRAKSSLADSVQPRQAVKPDLNNPQTSRQISQIIQIEEPPRENEEDMEEESEHLLSMRPDEERGFQRVELKSAGKEVIEHVEFRYEKDEFYGGNDTHRNLDLPTPNLKEEKMFEKFFKADGGVRRSMSLEDLRIDKKDFGGNHNKSTMHNPADLAFDSLDKSPDRSAYTDFKQSHLSPKLNFMSSLKSYIDYFNKSENVSYRNMKAGQYFRGNVGKSHRTMQKELDMMTQELNMTKLQMQKVKWTLNKVLEENRLLTKEIKAINSQEREKEQLFQEMQEEIIKLRQKNHHYKAKCAKYDELFKQERNENEHNLRSLKQVLANSINIALEHKSSPYRREKKAQLRNLLGDHLFSKKDRENIAGPHYRQEKRRLHGTAEPHGSIYETGGHHRGSHEHKESSMMFSPKGSFSSNEGQEVEGYSQQFSNSNEIENVYEGGHYHYQEPHQTTYRHNIPKNQQIKFLQEKLTELMHSDDISFSGQTTCAKTSTKTSRGQPPMHKKNIPEMEIPGYYLSKDRQSFYKHANVLGKQSPPEQRSRIMHHDYEGPPFLNDATEGSFSST